MGVLVGNNFGCQRARGLRAWTRADLGSATTRAIVRQRHAWSKVVARTSSRADDGQILLAEWGSTLQWGGGTCKVAVRARGHRRPWSYAAEEHLEKPITRGRVRDYLRPLCSQHIVCA